MEAAGQGMKANFTRICRDLMLGSALGLACGCGNPSGANIELRKQNQKLSEEVQSLRQQQQGAQQVIQGLRDSKGTLPTLPATRMAKLYTTHGINFNRLTGGAYIVPG